MKVTFFRLSLISLLLVGSFFVADILAHNLQQKAAAVYAQDTEDPPTEGTDLDEETSTGDQDTGDEPSTDATNEGFGVGVTVPGGTADGNYKTFEDWVNDILAFAIRAGGVLATLMVIYAGFKYMTSQGNPSAISDAKEIIIGALSGYALLFLVYLIKNFINVSDLT